MPAIRLTTRVAAPIDRVFDTARNIDLHVQSMANTSERAIAGRTSGLAEVGDSITWEATHFFVRQRLTVEISEFDRPNHFRDSMLTGAFKRFDHDHNFEFNDNATTMTDLFDFDSPLGLIGKLADRLFLTKYMTRLLEQRNQIIKAHAESPMQNGG